MVKGQSAGGEAFEHRFTCLKFEARRLVVPTRMLEPLKGTIAVIDAAEKSAAKPPAQVSPALHQEQQAQLTGDSPDVSAEAGPVSPAAAETVTAPSENAAPDARPESARKSLIFGGLRKELENRPTDPVPEPENLPAAAERHADDTQEPILSDAVKEHPEDGAAVRDTVDGEARECAGAQRVEEQNGKTKAADEAAESDKDTGGAKKRTGGKKNWDADENVVTSLPLYQGIGIQTENIGRMFFNWLKKGLIEKTILINSPVALVHIIEDGVLLLSPGLFKDFCVKHGMPESDHKSLSRKFDNLRLGVRNDQGMLIHIFWAVGSTRAGRVSGRVVPHHHIFTDGYPVPQANKFIKKTLTPPGE